MPKIDNLQKKNEGIKDGRKSDSDLSAILLPDQNIDAKIDPSAKSIIDNNNQVKQEKKHIHYTKVESQPEPKKQIQINLKNTQYDIVRKVCREKPF